MLVIVKTARSAKREKVTRFIWVFIALWIYDFDYTIPCHPSESLFAEILPTTSIKKLTQLTSKKLHYEFQSIGWQSRDKSANFCPNACLTNQLCINRFSQKNLSNDSTYRVSNNDFTIFINSKLTYVGVSV